MDERQHTIPPDQSASRAAERRDMVRRLRAAFEELDRELRVPSRLRWTIGAPFIRLDRARTLPGYLAHLFAPAERAEISQVLSAYGRAFDATAAVRRAHDAQVHPEGSAILDSRAEFEALIRVAEDAASTLCELLDSRHTNCVASDGVSHSSSYPISALRRAASTRA